MLVSGEGAAFPWYMSMAILYISGHVVSRNLARTTVPLCTAWHCSQQKPVSYLSPTSVTLLAGPHPRKTEHSAQFKLQFGSIIEPGALLNAGEGRKALLAELRVKSGQLGSEQT